MTLCSRKTPTPLFLLMLRQGVRPVTSTLPPASRERLARFSVAHAGMGSFDSARPSLREGLAPLRMTLLRGTIQFTTSFSCSSTATVNASNGEASIDTGIRCTPVAVGAEQYQRPSSGAKCTKNICPLTSNLNLLSSSGPTADPNLALDNKPLLSLMQSGGAFASPLKCHSPNRADPSLRSG
jgi:hypothetical protein